MARLPIPGSDDGTWGNLLNEYLAVSHDSDGTIKPNAVDASSIQDNSITNAKLVSGAGSNGQVLTKNSAATGGFEWTSTSGVPDATTGSKGIVQLAGDLAGTAALPTVPGLANKANTTTTISAGTGLTGGGDLSANRTLNVAYGTSAGTAAQGNDARITGAIQSTLVDAKGDLIVASAADTVVRVAVGSNDQVLTADSTQASGVKWATPAAGSGGLDPIAVRYGCKALTMSPRDISHADPQFLTLTDQRFYIYWLPLPLGTLITGVRLPISAIATGAGGLQFTVYQEDFSQLGNTGDVRNDFAAGSPNTWRNSPLTASASTTGSGVWVTALTSISSGAPSVVFSNTVNQQGWVANPADRKTALRIEGVVTPPVTLNIAGATDYIDFMIGIY